MTHWFDIRAVIKATFKKIFGSVILLILCINSKLLYDCLVKLGVTQEKLPDGRHDKLVSVI